MAAPLGALDTGALQQAWKIHKPTLTDKERKYFESFACDSLDAYLDKLVSACKTHRDTHLRTKIADWFEPILQVVQTLLPVAQAAMSVHPMPGNLILGGIVGIVQLAERLYEYQSRSMQTLSRMSAKMQTLLKYEKDLYQDNDFVLKAITLVFGDILKFCSKVFHFLEHRGELHARVIGFRWMVFRDFEKQLGEVVREFNENMEKVEARALECDKQLLKQIRANIDLQTKKHDQAKDDQDENNLRANELSRRILAQTEELSKRMDLHKKAELQDKMLFWLSPLKPENRYWELAEIHLEGTGTWLLDSSIYQDWKASRSNPILWVRGKPGCGKSFLAGRAVLDLGLTLDHKIALAYMFCERADSDKQTRRAILGALAKQVMNYQDLTVPALNEEYLKIQRSDVPPERLIWDVLKQSVATASATYLVIDALDECKDSEDLIKDLVRITRDNPTVKILVFSRDDVPLEDHLGQHPQLRPDDGANEKDLRAYLDSVLDDSDDKIELSEEGRQQCVLKADGVILWVELFRKSLRNRYQRSKRLRNISAMQPGLDSRYDVIFSELGHGYQDNRNQAWLIFLLVTHARSPMTASEMMELVTNDPPQVILDLETLHGARWPNKSYLVGLCSNLVFIHDGYVKLFHESVRDYLEDTTHELAAAPWKEEYKNFCKDPHAQLAKLCLEYLLLRDFDRGGVRTKRYLKKRQQDAPFLRYAATTWGWHVARAEEQDQLVPLIRRLVYSSPRRELCLQSKFFDYVQLASCIGKTQPLAVLAVDGLTQSIGKILSPKECVEQFLLGWQCFTGHVLEATVMFGHDEMVKFLLDLPGKIAMLGLGKDRERVAIGAFQYALRVAFARAITRGYASIVRLLIKAGADVNYVLPHSVHCLVMAVARDDLAIVQILLEKGADPNAKDNANYTALHGAAHNGNTEIARLLLLAGADPEARAKSHDMQTPLHLAALRGSGSFVRVLKECWPDFSLDMTAGRHGLTPLHYTSWYNRHEAALALLELGCEKEIKNCYGETALYIAAHMGQSKTVTTMVKHGCDITAQQCSKATPLHAAAESGKQGLLRCLLSNTPRDNWPERLGIVSDDGISILHSAIRGGNTDCIDFVLEFGGDIPVETQYGNTPFHYAALHGVEHLIRPLLCRTQDPNPFNELGITPLHVAASYGQVEFIRELIQVCKESSLWLDINRSNKKGSTALMLALSAANPEAAQLLLQEGASSLQSSTKNYPIHVAAWNGYQDITKALLSQPGAGSRGYQNQTVLHCAASSGKTSIMELLFTHVAEQLNAQDDAGFTPIIRALQYGHIEAANWLLDQQPDTAITTTHGQNLIHIAIRFGDLDFLRRVLDKACDPVVQDELGDTPLMLAVEAQKTSFIDELLSCHPESWRITNKTGTSCLQLAASQGNLDLLSRLEALGADIRQKNLVDRGLMHLAVESGKLELATYLHLRGCSLLEPDACGITPLMIAAQNGYGGIVRFILSKIDYEHIDYIAEFTGRSAIWYAAHGNHTSLCDMLVEAGANTLTVSDHSGISAADFLSTAAANQSENDDESTRRARHDAVVECCKRLKHIDEVSIKELYQHIALIIMLTRALRRIGDFDAAAICLMERRWVAKPQLVVVFVECQFCGTKPFPGDMFLCKSCLRETILCEACHKRYDKNGREVPAGLSKLNEIEKKIEEVRNTIPMTFDLVDTVEAICRFGPNAWLDSMVAQDEQWQQNYNTKGEFSVSIRPGHEFLRITSAAWKEKDELVATTSAAPRQEKDSTAASLKEEYTKFVRENPVGKLRSVSKCSGHDFMKISLDERNKLMTDNIKLDSKWGRMTDDFLQEIMTRHEAGAGRGNQAQTHSPSRPELPREEVQETQTWSSDPSAFHLLQTRIERSTGPASEASNQADETINNNQNREQQQSGSSGQSRVLPTTQTDSVQDLMTSFVNSIRQLQTAVRNLSDVQSSEQIEQTSTAVTSAATVAQADGNDTRIIELTQQDMESAARLIPRFIDPRIISDKAATTRAITEAMRIIRAAYRELYTELIPDSELVLWVLGVQLIQIAAPEFYEQYVEERREILAEGLDERDFENLMI